MLTLRTANYYREQYLFLQDIVENAMNSELLPCNFSEIRCPNCHYAVVCRDINELHAFLTKKIKESDK